MKIAALLCGLIAGLVALIAPSALGLDLITPFLKLWPATGTYQMLGTVAWYAIPAAALVGAVLCLLVPGFAAILLLGAGAGWLAAGLQSEALLIFPVLVPAGIAAIGGLLAFVAGELDIRQRRERRRNRRSRVMPLDPIESEEQEREDALRIDPQLMARDPAPQSAPQPREIPLKLEDVMDITPRQTVQQATQRRFNAEIRAEPLTRQPIVAVRPEPRRSGMGWLLAVNAVLIVAIGIGVGFVLSSPGTLGNLLSQFSQPDGPAPAAVNVPTTPQTSAATTPKPATPVPTAAATPTAVAAPAATTQVASVPAGSSYADPFAYCAALGTIDFVDGRYTGPAVHAAVAGALSVPADAARDRVRWRCFDGKVLACSSYDGPVCDLTPTVNEMIAYCKVKTEAERLTAPNGTWSCKGGRPELPPDATWPIDQRGFLPRAWVEVRAVDGLSG